MQRLGLYWSYATRSLERGGQRTLLAIFCVAVGVMAIVSLQLVGNTINTALTGNVRAGNGGDVSIRSDITPFNAQQLTTFDRLQADGTLSEYTVVVDNGQVHSQVKGQPQIYEMLAVDPNVFPLAGAPVFSDPSNGLLSSVLTGNTVVVTTTLLSQLGLHKGDALTVFSGSDGRSFHATIGGVIDASGFFTSTEMLVSIDTYKALPSTDGLPLQYNAVYVNVPGHTDANQDKAKNAISQALPGATVTTTKDALKQNQDSVQNIRYFLQIVGLLALLIGGVGIINTMQVLLRRRRVEIAMLKTTGYRQVDLYSLFGVEAGLLGLIGGVVGSLAGIGAGFLVKNIVENAVQLHLDFAVDPLTVLAGVAIGFFTALIFGIMPIVQASQVRPQAVLREMPEGATTGSILLSIVLAVLLGVLFFVMATVILGNVAVALGAVIGGGVFIAALSGVFTLVIFLMSKLPVPEGLHWGFLALIVVALLVSIGITLVFPVLGGLFIALSLLGLIVVFLPRTWKTNVKMALRNIGRQKVRTVTTMVALFIGVFSIGLILALGIGIRDNINSFLAKTQTYNSFILVNASDKPAVDAQLKQYDVKGKVVNTIALVNPVTVDGTPIGPIIKGATTGGSATQLNRDELLSYISEPIGYNLAGNSTPDVKIVKGRNDAGPGRNLNASDAGTNNVIMPNRATVAPLNLKLGSQVVMASQDGKTTVTVTVVGFYTGGGLITSGMYTDYSVVHTLAAGHEQYAYSLILDPTQSTSILNKIEAKVPSAQTFSLAQLTVIINSLLNNLITMLTAIASLAMIAGIIIIANAVALAMLERRRELGILKAVGHTSGSVLSEVLMENGAIGFTGGLLAMLIVSVALFILGLIIKSLDFGIGAGLILGVVFATAIVCMIVAAAVAWSATRVRPLEVLRYE